MANRATDSAGMTCDYRRVEDLRPGDVVVIGWKSTVERVEVEGERGPYLLGGLGIPRSVEPAGHAPARPRRRVKPMTDQSETIVEYRVLDGNGSVVAETDRSLREARERIARLRELPASSRWAEPLTVERREVHVSRTEWERACAA